MTTTELISIKLQEVLGSKYEVKPFSFFAKDYVQQMNTPYGKVYDVNYQAFEQMQNTIPVCVNIQETTPINSDVFYRTGIVTLQFYVPIDALGRDSDKPFDFFVDYERLREQLTDDRITILTYKANEDNTVPGEEEVDKTYYAFMTLTEPSTDGAVQSTGAYKRMVYTVQGNITLYDGELRTGSDYSIDIWSGFNTSRWYTFPNITNLTISRDEQGNSVMPEGTTLGMSPPVSRVHSVSFIVSDRNNSEAVALLRKAVFEMPEYITRSVTPSAQSGATERQVRVRIRYGDTQLVSFYALMSATYSVGGRSSVGSFSVSLTRSEIPYESAGY